MSSRLLFLGYGEEQTSLIGSIRDCGWSIDHTADPVSTLADHDLAISFGYRHILKPDLLATARRPVLNLHIAFLPFNRGAHPIFWAAMEGTPQGVTIHEIDAGIDTGPICYRRRVDLDAGTTFKQAHRRLVAVIEELFIDNMPMLLDGSYTAMPQAGPGTVHRVRDLPSGFTWDDEIAPTVERLRQPVDA